MAIFNDAIPANSEPVKLGAQRIREMKTTLNSALSQLFDDTLVFLANTITSSMLQSHASDNAQRAVDTNHIKTSAVTTPKIADDAVTGDKIADGAVAPVQLTEAARTDISQYATGTYAAGVYSVTLSPAITDYVAGMVVRFKADSANASGAVDINVNGEGAKNLFKNVDDELLVGEIPLNGVVTAVYDGTNFQVMNIVPVVFELTGEPWEAGTIFNTAHNLGGTPRWMRVVLYCGTADQQYDVGDELDVLCVSVRIADSTDNQNFSIGANSTNVWCSATSATSSVVRAADKDSGLQVTLTPASWTIRCYAQR